MNGESSKQRIKGFDALRVFMICCVVALHAAMTYMAYVPGWWYVIDGRQSFSFTLVVIFLDTFPMSVLFFLAGYFSPPSLAKRGYRAFIRGKITRLGIPWVFGVVFIAPVFAWASLNSLGYHNLSCHEIIKGFFSGTYYQQAHFWFLGVLLFFTVLYTIWKKLMSGRGTVQEVCLSEQSRAKTPYLPLCIVFILGLFSFVLSTLYIMPSDQWISVKQILYFQPSRIVGYGALFFLGVYGQGRGWFLPEGWMPNVSIWGTLTVASLMTYLAYSVAPSLMVLKSDHAMVAALGSGILYNLSTFATTIFLTAFSVKQGKKFAGVFLSLASSTYGIYWLHQMILLPLLSLFRFIPLPTFFLWLASILLTLGICHYLTMNILRKISFTKNIF